MERHLTIPSGDWRLAATLHQPHADEEKPMVIICHGFVGSRIGVDRLFVKAARKLCSVGHAVLRFDYAGCGESTGDYGAGGMDQLIEQTRDVIGYVLAKGLAEAPVILLGHSLGGAVALLTAARDRRVEHLILWSAVAHPFHDIVRVVGRRAYEEAVHRGSVDYLGYTLSSRFFASLSHYHPFQEVKNIRGHVLLLHGTSDEVIPADYCFLYEKLFRLHTSCPCRKELVFQANHTFSSGESCSRLLDVTTEWLVQLGMQKNRTLAEQRQESSLKVEEIL